MWACLVKGHKKLSVGRSDGGSGLRVHNRNLGL